MSVRTFSPPRPNPPTPTNMPTNSNARPTASDTATSLDDIKLRIADAESRGAWSEAGYWKSEQLRASRAPASPPSDTIDPRRAATDVLNLRDKITVAESARDFRVAAELKSQLLRIQSGTH